MLKLPLSNEGYLYPTIRLAMRKAMMLPLSIAALALLPGFAAAQSGTWVSHTINVQGGGTLNYIVKQVSCSQTSYEYLNSEYQTLTYTSAAGVNSYVSPIFMSPGGNTPDGICSGNYGHTSPVTLPFNQGTTPVSFNYVQGTARLASVAAQILPKYIVLGVEYAPPGVKSSVTYQNIATEATTSSLTNTFKAGTSVSVTSGVSVSIKAASYSGSSTVDTDYTVQSSGTSSEAITDTTTIGHSFYGPASSTAGVDHDYDSIYVWVNPVTNMLINPDKTLTWTGYSFDDRDPRDSMDVVEIPVLWLKNPSMIPSDVLDRLNRTWDTQGPGALTAEDYATILQRDPLVNTSYNPATDPSHRYMDMGLSFNYEPAAVGEQPSQQTYSLVHQSTNSSGQTATDTFDVGYSLDESSTAGASLFGIGFKFTDTFKSSTTLSWTNQWSSTLSNTAGTNASLSITGPASTDNYTGPTAIHLWKDNVYGTFMFFPQ